MTRTTISSRRVPTSRALSLLPERGRSLFDTRLLARPIRQRHPSMLVYYTAYQTGQLWERDGGTES